jgi:UDP-N-acetylglucosamine:LPS N-acetylglucosamine transferase
LKKIAVVLGRGGHTAQTFTLVDLLGQNFQYLYMIGLLDPLTPKKIRIPGRVLPVLTPRLLPQDSRIMSVFRTIFTLILSFFYFLLFRPKLVISCGTGMTVPVFFSARVLGIKTAFIESISRVESLSITGRLMLGKVNLFIVQWQKLADKILGTSYGGQMIIPDKIAVGEGKSLIFITVGTAHYDPLIEVMDQLVGQRKIQKHVVAQIGRGSYIPQNIRYFRFIRSLKQAYEKSKIVVSTGGAGTTLECTINGLPLLVVENKTLMEGHQVQLINEMEQRGHLIWCKELDNLVESIEEGYRRKFSPYVPDEPLAHKLILDLLET